jgi:hypothetical protein
MSSKRRSAPATSVSTPQGTQSFGEGDGANLEVCERHQRRFPGVDVLNVVKRHSAGVVDEHPVPFRVHGENRRAEVRELLRQVVGECGFVGEHRGRGLEVESACGTGHFQQAAPLPGAQLAHRAGQRNPGFCEPRVDPRRCGVVPAV